MKERLGLTEIRKQANRMSFGEVRTPTQTLRPFPLRGLRGRLCHKRCPSVPCHASPLCWGTTPASSLSPTSMHPYTALCAGPIPPAPRPSVHVLPLAAPPPLSSLSITLLVLQELARVSFGLRARLRLLTPCTRVCMHTRPLSGVILAPQAPESGERPGVWLMEGG